MTDTFDERRKSFEEKWAHDEELHFKVLARRDRLLGEWAAHELGLHGDAHDSYVKAIVQAELQKGGEHTIVHKLHHDFAAKNIHHSEHMIHKKMEELLRTASDQILHETRK